MGNLRERPERTSDRVTDLFARHLDLGPLRGRRRGLVRCVFHDDRRPSLSVDLDRGLFHCFGCGVGGGVKAFADLVGGRASHFVRVARRRDPRTETELWRHIGAMSDDLRRQLNLVNEARRIATSVGDDVAAWELLTRVARVEADAFAIEAEIDDMIRRRSER